MGQTATAIASVAVTMLTAGAVAGCVSGSTAAPSQGGADAASAGADADRGVDASKDGDAACVSECPAQEPIAGTACTTSCVYGVDAAAGCARFSECLSGQFQTAQEQCLAPAPDARCPASAADIPAGGTCDPNAPACGYPGTVCQCVYPYPVVDASYEWLCITIQSDCPQLAPLSGSACSPSGQSCNYGANRCAARGLGFFACNCGTWTELPPPPCK